MTAEELRRLLERRQKELIKTYQEAYAKLKKRLQEQELRGLSTYQTEALLNDIAQITEGLKTYVEDWIRKNYSLGYEEGSTEAVEKLNKKYKISSINVSFGGIHQSAVEAIINDTFRDVAAATAYMEEGLKQAIREAAKEKYTIGLIAGDTRRNITKGLVGELNQKGFTAYYDNKGRYIPLREYANALLEENWVGFVDKAGRRWDLLNYSEMLTRTKMAETVTRGTENRLTQNGFDLVIITSHGAEDWCRFYENKIFSISGKTDGYPKLEDAPNGGTPFHPRCVVGGALVTGPRPIVSFSRWHEGEVVFIRTASGNELTVTPNHPILTPKGWVAAGLLNKGDQVIRYLGRQGMVDTVDPDYVDVPTLIEKVANSFGQSGGVFTRTVPVAAEDFHGDGVGSDVCVVRTDGLLWNECDSTVNKPMSNHSFGFTNVRAMILNAKSTLAKLFKGLFLAANGIMGGGGQGNSSFLVETRPSCFHRFRAILSSFYSKLFESSLDGSVMNAEGLGNAFLGFPGLIAIKDLLVTDRKRQRRTSLFGAAQMDSELDKPSAECGFSNPKVLGETIQSFAGQIAFDTIIHVDRHTFAGHVYNLQTKYNWYACNSIITHNCKHREAPFVEKFESEETINFGKQLEPKFKELNTKDGRADQAALRKLERDTLKPNPKPYAKPQNIPFQKAKTLDEAKEWAEKKFPHIAWDFRGTGVDNLNPTLKVFDDLAGQYPEVVNRIKYIGTHKDPISPEHGYKWETGALAHASRDGTYIGINPNYYGGTYHKFTALTKKAAEQGFHPTVCNNVESILTHEFGHQVYNWIESSGGEITNKLKQFCQQNFSRDKAKTVSVYACYNEREAWAETFAALWHGGTKNEVVNAMKEFLEEIKNL